MIAYLILSPRKFLLITLELRGIQFPCLAICQAKPSPDNSIEIAPFLSSSMKSTALPGSGSDLLARLDRICENKRIFSSVSIDC